MTTPVDQAVEATVQKLPHHPEHHMTWTKLERRALLEYGKRCFEAGRSTLARPLEVAVGETQTAYCSFCETHVTGPCNDVMCPIDESEFAAAKPPSIEAAMGLEGSALINLEKLTIRATVPGGAGGDVGAIKELLEKLLLEAELFWWNDGPKGKSASDMHKARDAVLAHVYALATPAAEQVDAKDAQRFICLADYMLSDDTSFDDQLIACKTLDALRVVVDAIPGSTKGPTQ